MKYVKIKLSFGDKMRLLFLGVVPENKLPVKEMTITTISQPQPVKVEQEIINTSEEDFQVDIPFFTSEDSESNF